MGTDRVQEYAGSCDCGSGRYVVNFCTPDHPYPTQSKWWECNIECSTCSDTYTLEVRGNQVVQIRKADVQEADRRMREWAKAQDAAFTAAKGYITEFANRLREEPSVAAVYRHVKSSGLFPPLATEQTFRRHWREARSPETWIRRNLRLERIPVFLRFLGREDKALEAQVGDVEKMWAALTPPPGASIATVKSPSWP